jgi:hypothetical protein
MQLLVMGIGLFKSLLVVVHTPPPPFQPTFQTHFINLLMTPLFDQQLNGMSQNGKCLVMSLVIAGMWSFLVQSNQPKGHSLAENWSMALLNLP